MRYIGNKTRLLSFIGDVLTDVGIKGGHAVDAFAGTASVAAYLKERGFTVTGCDIMSYSYAFQYAYLEVDKHSTFHSIRSEKEFQRAARSKTFSSRAAALATTQSNAADASVNTALAQVLAYLTYYLPASDGFITESFSADDNPREGQRMYFTRANGMRIDAIRSALHRWHEARAITRDEFYVLLTALIDAADSVANTTGVYAAFVKSWQNNALRDIRLKVPQLVVNKGRKGKAVRGDINRIIGELGDIDLLYLDPPYNTRQYSGYYHVPEIIARGWFDDQPPVLRGKTGLMHDASLKSDWSRRDSCVSALEQLLASAKPRHILMSYNSEGIIPESEIERLFKAWGSRRTYRRFERNYARYRADSDHADRKYKAARVTEYLYYVRRT